MYIKEAKIDGFGALSGETCSFEAPVTVVYGPNEAGKSTLLRFIRSMLYGFANRSQPAERGEPVYGGRHGGRIAISDQGRLLLLERYADVAVRRGGAAAVLRDENGLELPVSQAELERRLLGGVSERLFRQLFAVTLDELQELRSLSGDEVGNYLYHAGMAGGAALTAAGKTLEAEREKLFKLRGSQPELNQALGRMRELEAELRRVRSGEHAFNEATLELEALERELREAEAGVPERRRQLALAQGALEAREWWLRLQAIGLEEEELASQLPDPSAEPLPEDAAARWERLLEDRRQADLALREAAAEVDELRRQRDQLAWDAELLAQLPAIEALEDQRESAAARREELAELTADLRLQDELLASLLARLSPSWGQEELLAFAALAERERARALQAGLSGSERELESVDAELRRVTRQLDSLAEEAKGSRAGVATFEARMSGSRRDAEDTSGTGAGSAEAGNRELDASWTASRLTGSAGLAAAGTGMGTGEPIASSKTMGSVDLNANGMRAGTQPGYGGGFAPSDRNALRQAWHRMEDELQQWERAKLAATLASPDGSAGRYDSPGRAAASRAKQSSGDGRGRMRTGLLAAAIATLGAVTAVLPAALGLEGAARTTLLAIAAALLLLAGVALGTGLRQTRDLAGGRSGGKQGSLGTSELLREAQAELAAAERGVAAAARELFRRPEEALQQLFNAEQAEAVRRVLRDAVYRELDRLEDEERGRSVKQETERKRAEWAKERVQLLREREALAAEQEERQRQWLAWLRERKLPAGLQPELLPELFQLAEQALQTLRQRDRLAERAASLQAGLAAFEAAAAPLLALAPPQAAPGAADAALAVKLLHREALRQRETAAEAGRLDERLRHATAAAASARAAREAADAAVLAACAAAGDAGEAAYERRLRVDERRRALARERRETRLRLAAGRDASGLAELEELLARHDEAALAMLLRQAEDGLRERETRVAELLDRRGRTAQRLERLREEAEAEDRLVAYEELHAEFARLADRYAVLSLTAELIRKTKNIFEEERQPEVLQKASGYFARMTDGAYARIVVPAAGETLLAETNDRRTIDAQMLSRGTREQLYLALRFALAGATSPAQALPLLLDDLFVHFDAVRLQRTAQVLGTVSQERQVVLFTCHEHVAQTIAGALPTAQVLRMARREAAAGASGLAPSGTSIQG